MASSAPLIQPSRNRKKKAKGAAASPAPELPQERAIDSTNGSQRGGDRMEKEYLRFIFKQVRRYNKKLESIAKTEEKIKDLTEEEKATTEAIEEEERAKIISKPLTLAVQKELEECYEKLSKISELEDKRIEIQKAEAEANLVRSVAEAKAEAIKEIDEVVRAKILTVVKFLRLAGHRRTEKSGDEDEDEAIEKVLVLVYGGDQSAVDACIKLAEGSEDPVEGFNVAYSRIKQVAHDLKVSGVDDEDVEEVPEPVVEPEQESEDHLAYNPENADTDYAAVQDGKASAHVEGVIEDLQIPLHQTYTNGEQTGEPATAPAVPVTDNDAANEAAKDVEFEGPPEPLPEGGADPTPESEEQPIVGTPEPVVTAIEENNPSTNGATASGSWADDQPKTPEPADEFQNVERRGRGGHRGDGSWGGHRGARSRAGHRRGGNGYIDNRSRDIGDRGYRGATGYEDNRGRDIDYSGRQGNRGDGSEYRGGRGGRGYRGDRRGHHFDRGTYRGPGDRGGGYPPQPRHNDRQPQQSQQSAPAS